VLIVAICLCATSAMHCRVNLRIAAAWEPFALNIAWRARLSERASLAQKEKHRDLAMSGNDACGCLGASRKESRRSFALLVLLPLCSYIWLESGVSFATAFQAPF
jgi:hypothetical protein